MSVLVIDYDILSNIAIYASSIVVNASEYADSLSTGVRTPISNLIGESSTNMDNAGYYVDKKIEALRQKSRLFSAFETRIKTLYSTAERVDQEVATMLAQRQETFLNHNPTLRMEDGWKADLINWFVDLKNKFPILGKIADAIGSAITNISSIMDNIKHWYYCEGGKYTVGCILAIGGAILAIVIFIATLPASGFFAVCAAIGAGIGAVNALVNVATSIQASYAAHNGDPAWAVIYGKRDKVSDVLREVNFGSAFLNKASHFTANIIDLAELFCDVVGVIDLGRKIAMKFNPVKQFFNKNYGLGKYSSIEVVKGKGKVRKFTFESICTGLESYFKNVKLVEVYDATADGGKSMVGLRTFLNHNLKLDLIDFGKSFRLSSIKDTIKYGVTRKGAWGTILTNLGNKDVVKNAFKRGVFGNFTGVLDKYKDASNVTKGYRRLQLAASFCKDIKGSSFGEVLSTGNIITKILNDDFDTYKDIDKLLPKGLRDIKKYFDNSGHAHWLGEKFGIDLPEGKPDEFVDLFGETLDMLY